MPLYKINVSRLRALMADKNLRIDDVCKLLNLNVDVFRKYYRGQASLMYRPVIESLAKVLEVDWQELTRSENGED